MTIRAYDPERDADALWALKRAFEIELGDDTGDREKERTYRDKLTDRYRSRYLAWVDRCVADEPRCVQLAAVDDGRVGYAFVLPERLAMIWDGAVLNELYVDPGYRGTGLADELLTSCFDVVDDQSLPLDRLLLDVDQGNERAKAFYRRHGFEHWGEMLALERSEH